MSNRNPFATGRSYEESCVGRHFFAKGHFYEWDVSEAGTRSMAANQFVHPTLISTTIGLFGRFSIELWITKKIVFMKGHPLYSIYRLRKGFCYFAGRYLIRANLCKKLAIVDGRNVSNQIDNLWRIFLWIEILAIVMARHGDDSQRAKVRTAPFGVQSVIYLGNKLWQRWPQEMKHAFPIFKQRIWCWHGDTYKCKLCKAYTPQVGFLTWSSCWERIPAAVSWSRVEAGTTNEY